MFVKSDDGWVELLNELGFEVMASKLAPFLFPVLIILFGLDEEVLDNLLVGKIDPGFVLKSFQLSVFDVVEEEDTKLFLFVTVDLPMTLLKLLGYVEVEAESSSHGTVLENFVGNCAVLLVGECFCNGHQKYCEVQRNRENILSLAFLP